MAATALAAETQFPYAAGTDSTGRAQAVSDAAGRVLIESPEFPRGLWVDLEGESGQALAGIQVEYRGRPDSLIALRCVDPSGLLQETLLWARPGGDPLRLLLRTRESEALPAGLAAIDWRIDPGAEELPVRPDLIGWEAVTAFLQERWQGRTGLAAVQVDSSTVAVDLDHPESATRLVDYLRDRVRRSLGEAGASFVQVHLSPYATREDLPLLEDSIVLTTSFVLVPGSELEEWVLTKVGGPGPVAWSEASALTALDLADRQIVDVSPLAVLIGLKYLGLWSNEIVDVSPLAALPSLERLRLGDNEIVDVSPLAALPSLERLQLGGNEIVDVHPLAALTDLERLGLAGNQISDVSSLAALTNLERLELRFNEIVDWSPLSYLTSLESLDLGYNKIVDLSPLSALTSLELLYLDYSGIVDLSPLSALSSLESLGLEGNGIVDLSPLSALTSLESLDLSGNGIADASPLSALTSLESLDLNGNGIADVSPLSALSSLESLYLDGNGIADASPLAALTA